MPAAFRILGCTVGILLAIPAGPLADASSAENAGDPGVSRLQGSAFVGRNRPVVGATVLVRRVGESSRVFVTASDDRGRFRVDGLPDGDYRIEVLRDGLRPVVKESVALRYPSRAVIEVLMQPQAAAASPAGLPGGAGEPAAASSVALKGSVAERDGRKPLPDVPLRFVATSGAADPALARSRADGSFELAALPAGQWRLEARSVGYLPLGVALDFDEDTELELSMVARPAGYDPSPLELMPPEQPVPPARFREAAPSSAGPS